MHEEALQDFETFHEISNLCECTEIEAEIDDFKSFEKDIEKFEENLFPRVEIEHEKVHNQFCYALLYALRFDKAQLKDLCNKEELEKAIDKDLVKELNQPEKFEFIIDLQKFHNMCYEINLILLKYGYFLRVFELKYKFRQLVVKDKNKQKLVRQLWSCLMERNSGFGVISIKFERKQRKKFKRIDIIYKPTKHIEIEPLCFFSDNMGKAYSRFYLRGKEIKKARKCSQCYY